ncbi:MAG: GNAT family N-acetyltransferase [Leptolyngbya sp. SIO3F4]|nr:GNAT family N-acetyltransferase [Leptolyngbya sp. SIO3F4]
MSVTTIRQAQPNDAEAVAHLAEQTFRDTFTLDNNLTDMDLHCTKHFGTEIQRQEILDTNSVTILAEEEKQLIGFAQVRLHSPKECVSADRPSELRRLYVSKEWYGRGIAHKIMSQILSTAAQARADYIWLGVWEHNPRAMAFYRKYGFKVVGEHVFQFGKEQQRDLVMVTEVNELFIA